MSPNAFVSRSDAELVRAMRDGETAALATLMRRHWSGLQAYAMRLADPSVADDLVQEFFLQLWERRHALHIDGSVRGYLYGGIRHHALNARHRSARRERLVERAAGDGAFRPAGSEDPDAAVQAKELAHALDEAISRLPPRCREIFILCRDGGLSYPEVADALGVSLSTVKTQMGRALAALMPVAQRFLAVALVAGAMTGHM